MFLVHSVQEFFNKYTEWCDIFSSNMDRSLQKLCNLPVFDIAFCSILITLNITNIEILLAFPVATGVQFALQVLTLAPLLVAGLPDAEAQFFLSQVSSSVDQLSLFWHLACAA